MFLAQHLESQEAPTPAGAHGAQEEEMKVEFFGVRGSIASAGPETMGVGGNTPCVVVETGAEPLIFDAGTGIRRFGQQCLKAGRTKGHLFFSHLHWDHIQGFPFFTPAYVPGSEWTLHGVLPVGTTMHVTDEGPLHKALSSQMTAPQFPVGIDCMRGDLRFVDVPAGEVLHKAGAELRHVHVDHPNGCVAWRVDHDGKSVVYATDLEHDPDHPDQVHEGLCELARDVDVLIYDAQYTPEEYAGEAGPSRRGWGHSTFEAAALLAERSGAKQLMLFHHDPSHDDAFMADLEQRAQRRWAPTQVAREGMVLSL